MTIDDLEAAGYRKYTGQAAKLKSSDFYYAKTFTDEKGKKYQMVVYVYTYGGAYSFMPDVQFNRREDDFCVDITYHTRQNTPLADVEAYYEKQWLNHDSPYYDLWDLPAK